MESLGTQIIQFVIGIILARLLSPEDYGLVAIIYIFTSFSTVIIDSGFKTSIIRTPDLTIQESSTIFWYNTIVSLFVSGLLFLSADYVSFIFHKPQLALLLKVFSIVPIINSFGLVQNALMFRNLDFKLNTKIVLVSNTISGIFAIFLAVKGYSYWSLIVKAILQSVLNTSFYWVFNKWKPLFVFDLIAFRKHFRFGNKLLLVGLIDTVFDQVYSFIIGKFYSLKDLGLYKRGEGYVELVSKSISRSIQKVNSPILAVLKSQNSDIIGPHRKIVSNSCFAIYPMLLGLASIASPLILVLIGEKWLPSVVFLQLLALSRLAYPIINSGASVLEVLGRSDLNLKYTLINRSLLVIILIFSTQFGIISLIIGKIIHSFASAILIMYFVEKTTNLKIYTQILDISRIFLSSLLMAIVTYLFVYLVTPYLKPIIVLMLSLLIGGLCFYLFSMVLKLKELSFALKTFKMIISRLNTKKQILLNKDR